MKVHLLAHYICLVVHTKRPSLYYVFDDYDHFDYCLSLYRQEMGPQQLGPYLLFHLLCLYSIHHSYSIFLVLVLLWWLVLLFTPIHCGVCHSPHPPRRAVGVVWVPVHWIRIEPSAFPRWLDVLEWAAFTPRTNHHQRHDVNCLTQTAVVLVGRPTQRVGGKCLKT